MAANPAMLLLEFVDGEPITKYCAALDRTARLRLFLKICEAVEHAHRNLLVHRDHLSANILVTATGDRTGTRPAHHHGFRCLLARRDSVPTSDGPQTLHPRHGDSIGDGSRHLRAASSAAWMNPSRGSTAAIITAIMMAYAHHGRTSWSTARTGPAESQRNGSIAKAILCFRRGTTAGRVNQGAARSACRQWRGWYAVSDPRAN